jgi:uncharacterized protein YecE (DUF72 family)
VNGGRVDIGTAGWSIPRSAVETCAGPGTHLERYARVLTCVEINSCFYRPHRESTYARWRESTPQDFRFAVKLPKQITHERRLTDAAPLIDDFLRQTAALGEKRGPILVQLPPSLAFDAPTASRFFDTLRDRYDAAVVCEPRHPTWFAPDAGALMTRHRIARVAADPAVVPAAAKSGGFGGLVYVRWHGSPRTYWSRYEPSAIASLHARIDDWRQSAEVWCIFDNTAAGFAIENAIALDRMTIPASSHRPRAARAGR